MSQVAKSSLIVTSFTVLGLGLGFFSNVVVAKMFGARANMDVFLAATAIPTFITSVLSSSLNFTFIPVFAEYRTKDPQETWKVVSSFMNLGVVVAIALCLVGITFAPYIVRLSVPGFTEAKLAHTIVLFRYTLPVIVFVVINELMAGIYYSNGSFVVPSLNKVISPALTMGYVWLFGESLSTKSLVLAILTSMGVQTVLLTLGLLKNREFHYSLVFAFRDPGVLKILKLMGPLLLGLLVYRCGPVLDRFFLSRFPDGVISHIGYATKLIGVLSPVLVSGISLSLFPVMSRHAAEHDMESLKRIMSKGLRMLFFITLPVTCFLGAFGLPLIRLLFERGAFLPADSVAVYRAFWIYLLALPAATLGTVVGQGFYVLQDTRTVALLGVAEMVAYVLLCVVLIPELGSAAIPLAYATYLNVFALITVLLLRYKLGNRGGAHLMVSMGRHVAAAFLSLGLVAGVFGLGGTALSALLKTATAFLAYFCISWLIFRSEEAASIYQKGVAVIRARTSRVGGFTIPD